MANLKVKEEVLGVRHEFEFGSPEKLKENLQVVYQHGEVTLPNVSIETTQTTTKQPSKLQHRPP